MLCLGDTLTHLPDRAAVQRLLASVARILARRALVGWVEALDADHVSVTDIITTAGPDGLRTQIGSYPKLRLAPADVVAWATGVGLGLGRQAAEAGMLVQLFRAPT